MSDPIQVVEEIRAFLQAKDQSFTERLTDLAEEYRGACVDVNRRLSRCAQLLRQGLRGEALHLAEAAPNLLEVLACLDFPERSAWLDLVAIYTLPSPPELDGATAQQLNAAYAEHDPLKNLLKKHRRLALARAPLRERIGVLRELGRVDATNPIWGQDLASYENARLKQIQAEAAEAARRHDVAAAAALDAELSSDGWVTRPSPALAEGIRKMLASFRQQEARQQLVAYEGELNDAFAALDVERARRARKRWQAAVAEAKLSAKDPCHERAEPALLWLQREEAREAETREYQAAVRQLVQALNEPTPRPELDEVRQSVARFEQGVPEPLETRYRLRLDADARAVRQRVYLFAGAGVTGILVLIFLVLGLRVAFGQDEIGRPQASELAADPREQPLERDRTARPADLQTPAAESAPLPVVAAGRPENGPLASKPEVLLNPKGESKRPAAASVSRVTAPE